MEPGLIKSTAVTILKQKIENKDGDAAILKMQDKYREQSRFCNL